jgi:hypothetical protein
MFHFSLIQNLFRPDLVVASIIIPPRGELHKSSMQTMCSLIAGPSGLQTNKLAHNTICFRQPSASLSIKETPVLYVGLLIDTHLGFKTFELTGLGKKKFHDQKKTILSP